MTNHVVDQLLKERVIEQGPVKVLHKFFHIPKKDPSQRRPILAAHGVNEQCDKVKFRMEGLKEVKQVMRPGDEIITVDVSKAYNHLLIDETLRQYLGFQIGSRTFRYRVAVMGLSPVPYQWTQLMKAAISGLREQEQSSALASERVSWHDYRQQGDVYIRATSESSQPSSRVASTGTAPLNSSSRIGESSWQTSKFQWRHGGCQEEVSAPSPVHGQGTGPPASVGGSTSHVQRLRERTSPVGHLVTDSGSFQDSTGGFSQASSPLDGQQFLRLGLGDIGRNPESRSLQQERTDSSHQCKRSSRSAVCTSESVINGLSDSCSHRQSSPDCSAPEGLFHAQSGSQQDHRDDSIPVEGQNASTDSHIYSVQGQQMGRPAEPPVQLPGLAAESSLLPVDRPALRDANGRCFCIPDKPLCTEMVFATSGTGVGGDQCAGTGLVRRASPLRKRPLGVDSPDLEESPGITARPTGDFSSSSMENQGMVADGTTDAAGEDRASPSTRSVSASVHCARRRSGLPALADLDSEAERRAVAELAHFFDSSLAASTRRQYQGIWSHFEEWLASNHLSATPSPEIVAFYMYKLLLTGKYSTATLKNKFIELKRCLPQSVRKSETLTMMMKCIEKFGKPPATHLVNMDVRSVWPKLVNTSVDFQSSPGPNATWKTFALHTAFMVGLCNAARANCLSQVDASLIVKHDTRYVLPVGNVPQKGCAATKFGKQKSLASKATKSPRQLEVYDCPQFPVHLNPYKLLEQYLASTSAWRALYGSDTLFWTLRPTKGPKGDRSLHHRAASSSTISGWITQTLAALGVQRVDGSQCKGHDLRRLAISLFLRAGYSPEQVKEFLQLSSSELWIARARYSHRLSDRRLWRLRATSSDPQTPRYGNRSTAITWADNFPQEQSSALASERVSWHDYRQQGDVYIRATSESSQPSSRVASTGTAPLNSSSRIGESSWQTSKFQWRHGGCQEEVSAPSPVHGQGTGPPASVGGSTSHVQRLRERTSPVGHLVTDSGSFQDSTGGFSQASSPLDGQQFLRLGLGDIGRNPESRSLQQERTDSSHQCKRSSRSAVCTSESVINGLSDSCSHRQSSPDCSAPEGLFHAQSGSQQDHRDDSIPVEGQNASTDSHIYSVQGQQMGRPAEPPVQLPGLAAESSLLPVDRPALRDANGRCFCIPDKPLCTEMVFATSGTGVGGDQCAGTGLVRRASPLRKRPLGVDSPDLEESPGITARPTGDFSSSSMENQGMVADGTTDAAGEDRASPSTRSVSASVHCARRRSGLPALADLDSEAERRAVAELAHFFDSSLAASTRRQYQGIWSHFEEWLASNHLSATPSPEIVAFYMYKLLLTGKYSTATLKNKFIELKRCLPQSVRKSETLTMMMKCIEKFGKPPATHLVNMDVRSVWPKLVNTSVDFQSSPGPNATWKTFALHTAFMVGLCNAARANCLSQVDASLIVKHDTRYVLPVGNVPQKGCAATKFVIGAISCLDQRMAGFVW
eukprot:Nk52_evm14s1762 gene=Nk52_evmTU14s1762